MGKRRFAWIPGPTVQHHNVAPPLWLLSFTSSCSGFNVAAGVCTNCASLPMMIYNDRLARQSTAKWWAVVQVLNSSPIISNRVWVKILTTKQQRKLRHHFRRHLPMMSCIILGSSRHTDVDKVFISWLLVIWWDETPQLSAGLCLRLGRVGVWVGPPQHS